MTLQEYLTLHLKTPFEWGKHDCVLFVANWVKHKTGADPLDGLPAWSNEEEAHEVIRKVGGIVHVLDTKFKRINPHMAKDGDIALVEDRIALFSGTRIAGPSFVGLLYVNRLKASCAWSF
jgi:hypothetical protein